MMIIISPLIRHTGTTCVMRNRTFQTLLTTISSNFYDDNYWSRSSEIAMMRTTESIMDILTSCVYKLIMYCSFVEFRKVTSLDFKTVMGASLSVDSTNVDSQSAGQKHLLSLYRREFEREDVYQPKEQSDRSALYLDDYGDDEDENVAIETPAIQPVEDIDDEYPTDRLNTHFRDAEPSNASDVPVDIRHSFETARLAKQQELDDKYPRLSEREPPCANEKNALMQCYKEHDDILNCREMVENYARCAKSSSGSLDSS